MAINGILLNNNTSSNLQITDIVSIRSEPVGKTFIENFIPNGQYYFAIDSIILSYNKLTLGITVHEIESVVFLRNITTFLKNIYKN